jgi:tRNA threonylcarbamoyladenosine biosynthesis protein TsaE
MTVTSCSPEDTDALGYRIGKALRPGSVLALIGPLGAGKTTLVKGIARGLRITDTITSPSFTLISEYRSPEDVQLYHIDLYRITSDQELTDIGLEELVNGQAISVIEWGERAAAFLPSSHIDIRIEIGPELERKIFIQGLKV